jgi:DNA-binding CsgD family transcriptional regulator
MSMPGKSAEAPERVRPASDGLEDAIGKLELPMVLIDLSNFTVSAVSRAALKRFGMSPGALVGQPLLGAILDADRQSALSALQAMRDGAIDFYRATTRIHAPGGQDHVVTAWVRRLCFGDRPIALAEVLSGTEPQRSPLAQYFGRDPLTMVVGTTDANWVITSVSTDIRELLGMSAEEAKGRRFLCSLEQTDVRKLLEARGQANPDTSVAVRVRLQDGPGAWRPLYCVLTSLAGSTELCFMLLPEDELSGEGNAMRVAQLEQHLWRIAGEVEASGILRQVAQLPEPARLAHVGGLTARQWEVLRRLLRGERVPSIAQELFVTQSTVRNHLAAIFERFGVHSQPELLAKLAGGAKDDSSS